MWLLGDECCKLIFFFFFQAEDGIRDHCVTGSSDVCSSDLTNYIIGLRLIHDAAGLL